MRVSLKYAVTSRYSGLSGVKVAVFTSSSPIERYERYASERFRCGTRGATVHGCYNFRYALDSQSMLLSTTQEQNLATALGIHRLKANPTVREVSPRTVTVRHQRYNKKPAKPAFNQRPCQHSMHRVAHAFPIQFPVLYCPWWNFIGEKVGNPSRNAN